MKKTDNMTIEDFQLYNQRKTLTWLLGIYLANILLSLVIEVAYNLFNDVDTLISFSIVLRLINLLITSLAFLYIYKDKIYMSKLLLSGVICLSIFIQIYQPSDDFNIRMLSFTLTIIVALYMITTLWNRSSSSVLWGAIAFIAININGFSTLLKDTPIINNFYAYMIIFNYLIAVIAVFNISVTIGNNRLLKYLKTLIYVDLKTGFRNERDLEVHIKKKIEAKDHFSLICLHITNLSELNSAYSYNVIHQLYLKEIQKIKDYLPYLETPYKMDGPLFTYIVNEEYPSISEDLKGFNSLFNNHHLDQIDFKLRWFGTTFPKDGNSPFKLISNIYHLSHMNQHSHHKVRWYNQEDYILAQRQKTLEHDLYHAIQDCEMSIVLQAQVNLKTKQLHGAEVLARWQHPTYGSVSPFEFIPMIDRLDLMDDFTQCIFNHTRSALKQLEEKAINLKHIAINISPNSIMSGSIVKMVQGWPNILELEITEQSLMELSHSAKSSLEKIKEQGYALAIDDFGTGYSNLQSLHTLDIEYLKIDKQFIDAMTHTDKALKLVEAILSMAHTLNIQVIAEGVETKEQFDLLSSLNCEIVQGYYYAKPVSVTDFIERYKKTDL